MDVNLPDLSQSLRMISRAQSLRAALDDSGTALTTGAVADARKALGGSTAALASADRGIALAKSREAGLARASLRASYIQTSLQGLQSLAGTEGLRIISATGAGDIVSIKAFTAEARASLDNTFAKLQGQLAGDSLFAGAALDTQALAPSEDLMVLVRAELALATDAADAQTRLNTLFDTPGGPFETLIWQGSDTPAPGAPLEDGSQISFAPLAKDQAFRDMFKGLSLAAAIDEGAVPLSSGDQNALLTQAGTWLLAGEKGVIDLKSALGTVEQRIADAQSFETAQIAALETARTEMIGMDQYAEATRFTALEAQLDALYTITARISALNFTRYIA
ncbi:MAG: flagellin [Pseudomonadota bacterium]